MNVLRRTYPMSVILTEIIIDVTASEATYGTSIDRRQVVSNITRIALSYDDAI